MPSLLVSPRNEPESSLSEHEWSDQELRLVLGYRETPTVRILEPQADGRELVLEDRGHAKYWVYR